MSLVDRAALHQRSLDLAHLYALVVASSLIAFSLEV